MDNKEYQEENGKRENSFGKDFENKQGSNQAESRVGNRGDKPGSGEGVENVGSNGWVLSNEEAKNLGGSGNVEASDDLRRYVGTSIISQQQTLIKWATESGCLFDENDYKKLEKYPHMKISEINTESDVFFINDTVIKVVKNFRNFIASSTPLEFLDNRIMRHNKYFPETAYTLLGIMSYGDIFAFVTMQPFIEGAKTMEEMDEKARKDFKGRIDAKLKEMGFEKDRYSYKIIDENGNLLRLSDTHIGNFIEDKDGNMFCIDSVFEIADR